ncbi:hypothetical protein [Paenibacillus sp. MMS20-IR301]|uniref:TolB family protein n=1 Tax=Paenibacillus sp. MMS20-IR301 TaxID=2895946 RepID=UPI0028E43A32|nr:hypothetical protein [Paenibacillus sp. MMS20-IR301]WNS41324.1 hypothetical protein LOS79_20065 [Paenibacillus sp. MMS20-IR301]
MKNKLIKVAAAPVLLMSLIACNADQAGNAVVTPEPTSTAQAGQSDPATAVPEATAGPAAKPAPSSVAAGEIEHFEDLTISDWVDDNTVIVSKENEQLGTMSLAELSGSYPKSLYLYHLDTKEYELLKEQKDTNLGEAELSPDGKYLLYSEYTLGDPAYYVMDLGSKKTSGIKGEPVAGAISAEWADDNTVVGPAYSGGAFTADVTGKIAAVKGLGAEGLIIVRQSKDKLYYTSNSNETLQMLDRTTGEQASLPLDRVGGVVPSPDGTQLLVQQYTDTSQKLLLTDAGGENPQVIVEGAELGGFSWSPDQQRITYSSAEAADGDGPSALYIYDLSTKESAKIAEGSGSLDTSWSPSGKALSYNEWDGKRSSSNVVPLVYGDSK